MYKVSFRCNWARIGSFANLIYNGFKNHNFFGGANMSSHSMLIVGWLVYTMLRMCDGVDTDQDGSSVSFARPILC